MIRLPGLIGPHVHVREPGQTHKEDWDTATQAAVSGGVTTILAMPNTRPPIFDASTLDLALDAARAKSRCDYAQFVGAGPDNADILPSLATKEVVRILSADGWVPREVEVMEEDVKFSLPRELAGFGSSNA